VKNLTRRVKLKIWLLLWLLLFVLALAWRAQNLNAFGLVNDEGAYLMWARLAGDGYPLYSKTQAVQTPLFLEAIKLAFALAGPSIQVGRWAMLVGFMLLAVALSWLAYRAGGRLPALVVMFLLGVAPLIFTFSRLVMAEVPATALAATSLALGFVYLDKRQRGWLFVSGLALGLSFITKALNPFVAAPLGLLLLVLHLGQGPTGAASRQWRNLFLDGVLWSSGVLLPLAVLPLFYNPAGLYDQLVVFRQDLRTAIPGDWPDTGAKFQDFFRSHWGFWLLAGAGIFFAAWRSMALRNTNYEPQTLFVFLRQNPVVLYTLTWTIWLVAGLLMLLWHTPLFPHHFVVLLPPLILLASGFIADVAALSRQNQNKWALALWLVIGLAAFNLPAIYQANQKTAAIVTGGREREALELLEAVSAPADFVMGDSQLLIFMAGRRTPPQLGDVALVAIKAGRQTAERMRAITEEEQAPAVVQWSLRLPWLPEYLTWVEENYLAQKSWDNDHIIYYAPRFPAGRPLPNKREVELGDSLRLRGFAAGESTTEQLTLKLYWLTQKTLVQDYTVFTQLLDKRGARVAGWDSQPLGGYFPTSRWPAGEIVTDIVQIPLPPDLPPGEYSLITGMYLLDSGERLRQASGADYINLTTIIVP
jgi:hypothetical protein